MRKLIFLTLCCLSFGSAPAFSGGVIGGGGSGIAEEKQEGKFPTSDLDRLSPSESEDAAAAHGFLLRWMGLRTLNEVKKDKESTPQKPSL